MSTPAKPSTSTGSYGWLWQVFTLGGALVASALLNALFWHGIRSTLGPTGMQATHWLEMLALVALAGGVAVHHQRRRFRTRIRDLTASTNEGWKRLRRSERLLATLLDNDPTGVVLVDGSHRVLYANNQAQRVHGGEIAGRLCYEAMAGRPEACRGCTVDRLQHPDQEGPPHSCRLDTREGEILEVESRRVELPGGQSVALLLQRVVTEERKLQARMVHQEKMAAFGLLAAGIAHEMGNPLSAIGLHLQLLEAEDMPPAARESVETVRSEVERLQRTLRELVGFSRRPRDTEELVCVRDVVEDALRLVRYDRRMRRVEVDLRADRETAPVSILEDHLMQVVLNLLLNALDAMPEGGRLAIEVGAAEAEVALRVRDDGVGMERSHLERCFEPLFSTKPPGSGTGLGLPICRDLLETAGGRIELHSAPGRGTTAIVTLPACAEAPATHAVPEYREAAVNEEARP